MADYDSSLPIRTEAAGDVDIFISDATTPSQKLKVNADGSVDTNFATGSQIEITDGTETLLINVDGSLNAVVTATDLDIRSLVFATDKVDVSGSEVSLDAATLAALETTTVVATDLDIRNLVFATDKVDVSGSTVAATQSGTWNIATVTTLTGITNDVNIADGGNSITVDAVQLDVDDLNATDDAVAAHLFDEAGVAFSPTNPLAVEVVSDQLGDEVCDYNTSAAVAKNATVNHDYTVTAAKTLLCEQAFISGTGKLRAEVLINGVSVFVGFNSTANPNIEIPMKKLCKGAATQVVRIAIKNRDNAQDVYSTLTGLEV